MMIEKKMIQLDKVSFSYEPGRPILQDLSLHIHKGESVGLIGANGAGKSTILKLMLGLLTAQSGTVRVDGLDMNKENIATIRRKLGFVLQNSDNQLFMPTVEEDMMFAPLNYGMDREEAEKKVDRVLEQLNLTDLKYRHNHRISGGGKAHGGYCHHPHDGAGGDPHGRAQCRSGSLQPPYRHRYHPGNGPDPSHHLP